MMFLALATILLSTPLENPLLYIHSYDLSAHTAAQQKSSQLKWTWSPQKTELKPALHIERIGPFHDVPLKTNTGWLKEKHSGKSVYKVNWNITLLTTPATKLWVSCVYDARTHKPLTGTPRSDWEYITFSLDKHSLQITCNPIYLPQAKNKKSKNKK